MSLLATWIGLTNQLLCLIRYDCCHMHRVYLKARKLLKCATAEKNWAKILHFKRYLKIRRFKVHVKFFEILRCHAFFLFRTCLPKKFWKNMSFMMVCKTIRLAYEVQNCINLIFLKKFIKHGGYKYLLWPL